VWPQIVLGWRDGDRALQEGAKKVIERAIEMDAAPEICYPSAARPQVKFYLVRQFCFNTSKPPPIEHHLELMKKYPLLRFEGLYMFPGEPETERRYYHEVPDLLDRARLWLHSRDGGPMVTDVFPDEDRDK